MCEFVVYAEPHALKLASYRSPIPGGENEIETAWIALPLDPDLWRQSEIDRFLIQEIDRFRDATESAIRALNPGA